MRSAWQVSALIKEAIDRLRESPGYAGMVLYLEEETAFIEGIEPELADGLRALLPQNAKSITAIMRGYSLIVLRSEDMVAIARLEGRYGTVPAITIEEDDIAIVEPVPRLMTREEARHEAEELLRRFNLMRND